MPATIEFLQIPPHWGLEFQKISFGGHIDIQPYHAPRPTVSKYSNFSFVTQRVLYTEMELGVQTSLLWMTLVKDLVVEAALGRGTQDCGHVCSVSWLAEPCSSVSRGGPSRQKWPESVLLRNAVSLLPP